MGLFSAKNRFYCVDCDKFIDRRKVYASMDYTMQPVYFCKWCDSQVIQTEKVLQSIIKDTLAYDKKHGIDIEKYM